MQLVRSHHLYVRMYSQLIGHKDTVTSLTWSRELIFTGGNDKIIGVWNASSFELVTTFGGHARGLTSIAASADGSKIVSGSKGKRGDFGQVQVWSLNESRTEEDEANHVFLHDDRVGSHEKDVSAVDLSGDGTLVATAGGFDQTL